MANAVARASGRTTSPLSLEPIARRPNRTARSIGPRGRPVRAAQPALAAASAAKPTIKSSERRSTKGATSTVEGCSKSAAAATKAASSVPTTRHARCPSASAAKARLSAFVTW